MFLNCFVPPCRKRLGRHTENAGTQYSHERLQKDQVSSSGILLYF